MVIYSSLKNFELESEEKLNQSSKNIKIHERKYYTTSCSVIGRFGKEFCGYFGLVFKNENDNEILRRIKWINDFSKNKKKYELTCRAEPKSKFVNIIFRLNSDGSNTAKLSIDLPDVNSLVIEETDSKTENFDELYDYKLIWSRRKNWMKNDWSTAGQTKEQFKSGSENYLKKLESLGLEKNSQCLDIGCGLGRLSNALLNFLDDEGCYYGLDIGKESIDYCKKQYQRKNFFFLQNKGIDIPIENKKFDFITFMSVFTHLYPQEIIEFLKVCRNFLKERGVVIADLLEESEIKDYSGDRGKMVYDFDYFISLLNKAGYDYQRTVKDPLKQKNTDKWGGARRHVLKIFPQN